MKRKFLWLAESDYKIISSSLHQPQTPFDIIRPTWPSYLDRGQKTLGSSAHWDLPPLLMTQIDSKGLVLWLNIGLIRSILAAGFAG